MQFFVKINSSSGLVSSYTFFELKSCEINISHRLLVKNYHSSVLKRVCSMASEEVATISMVDFRSESFN